MEESCPIERVRLSIKDPIGPGKPIGRMCNHPEEVWGVTRDSPIQLITVRRGKMKEIYINIQGIDSSAMYDGRDLVRALDNIKGDRDIRTTEDGFSVTGVEGILRVNASDMFTSNRLDELRRCISRMRATLKEFEERTVTPAPKPVTFVMSRRPLSERLQERRDRGTRPWNERKWDFSVRW